MIRHLVLLALAAATAPAQTTRHRAILISFDGLSEGPARMFADSNGALSSLFRSAACADGSRPSFVSVTPAGHAAIWTGAYANVNGIFAIANGALPLAQTTILESTDGYRAPAFSAEPIWIAAARQGKRVFSQMATQSPQPPGYPAPEGASTLLGRKRADAAEANQRWELAAVNVYNERVAEDQILSDATHPAHVPATWQNLGRLGASTPLQSREVSWAFGASGDSLHALFAKAADGKLGVIVSKTRDVARGVFARPIPTDTARSTGRQLARYFSRPLRIDLANGRRAFVYARLFELAPDLSRYVLYVSEARVTQGNRPEVARDFDDRVQGVPGNGAERILERGGFGPPILQGGDGSAELRYLETAELVTRQYMRGTEAGWSRYAPDLLVDYLPYPDEALHSWYAIAHPSTPGISPPVRARATRLLGRAYDLVDRRLLALRRIAQASPGTMLFVTGEHGMRPSWLSFRPNVLLKAAGLVATDASGNIDLTRTLAAATRGWWISVNRDTRKSGIVPRDSVEAVLRRVEATLRAAKDSTGAPIVTQIWRATSPSADSLGFAGPAGGDLYYGLTLGYYPNASVQGAAVSPMQRPMGEHGFPSTDRDMWPALCVVGDGVRANRFGAVRAIDIAPTVSEWLGVSPPADARGRSLLREIRQR